MKNWKVVGLMTLLTIPGVFISQGLGQGGGFIECEDGCYSFWTGHMDANDVCYRWDPYSCVEGNSYMADTDEGGTCTTVVPQEDVIIYKCDESCCSPVCNNCPANLFCLHYHGCSESECLRIDTVDRKDCFGGSQ